MDNVNNRSQISTAASRTMRWAVPVAAALSLVSLTGASTARAESLQYVGYHIGEQGDNTDADAVDQSGVNPDNQSEDTGPVRLARFSYIEGNVSWRPDANSDWSDASVNLPLRPGAQIWVTGQGRAEIQFDDGSYLRLGDSAVATLQSMNSDENGEVTQIALNDGLASLRLKNDRSLYDVDTAVGSVSASGPAHLRIGSDSGLEVAVREGSATVETDGGNNKLGSGDYLYMPDADAQPVVDAIPDKDSWDAFNDERDRVLDASTRPEHEYLPPSIGLVAGNLDDYGSWHDDPRYGEVWCPAVTDTDWRPYEHGHWVWVNPFGWTWVGEEPWGWAPYHYGTWVDESWGWSWVPGPARQYWSPAVVHFTQCDDNVAWVALAPADVHYSSIAVSGFIGGNWWMHFSIGGCAVYQPAGAYCVPHPWHNGYVNRGVYAAVRPVAPEPDVRVAAYVPFNARHGAAVISVASNQFAVAVSYHAAPDGADLFRRGRWAPERAGAFVAGPAFIRPERVSYTPARSFQPRGEAPVRLGQPVHRTRNPEVVRFNAGVDAGSNPNHAFRGAGGNTWGGSRGGDWRGSGTNDQPSGGNSGRSWGHPTWGGGASQPTNTGRTWNGPDSQPTTTPSDQSGRIWARQPGSDPTGERSGRIWGRQDGANNDTAAPTGNRQSGSSSTSGSGRGTGRTQTTHSWHNGERRNTSNSGDGSRDRHSGDNSDNGGRSH